VTWRGLALGVGVCAGIGVLLAQLAPDGGQTLRHDLEVDDRALSDMEHGQMALIEADADLKVQNQALQSADAALKAQCDALQATEQQRLKGK
jgi:hypothetical protein